MKDFDHWCKHYGCEPASPEAKADYERYREQLALFQALPSEHCFLDDKGSTADSFSYRPKTHTPRHL